MIQVLAYRYPGWGNLGDAVQTYALCRLLPPAVGVYRDQLWRTPPAPVAVVNGYLCDRPPARSDCLFAGVYVERGRYYRDSVRWLRSTRFRVVGARDPVTCRRLTAHSVATDMAGCATLTLERYSGPRRGVYAVDLPGAAGKAGADLTHRIPPGTGWAGQWKRAIEYLSLYRTAERVYTSRLHVALPCLAFGTPVYLDRPSAWFGLASTRGRFSLYDALGLPYRTWVEADVGYRKQRFIRFLEDTLGRPVRESEPDLPRPSAPEHVGMPILEGDGQQA